MSVVSPQLEIQTKNVSYIAKYPLGVTPVLQAPMRTTDTGKEQSPERGPVNKGQ